MNVTLYSLPVKGTPSMTTEKLKQSYKEQLVRVGVDPHKAEQAAKLLTGEELQMISEIWPGWAAVFPQVENELLAVVEA